MRAALAVALILLGLVAIPARPAHAALTLCNRTSYILYAATSAVQSPRSETHGWTRIAPGDCQLTRKEPLTAETYLVHARSSLAHSGPARSWGGNHPVCVKDGNFDIKQSATQPVCTADGTFPLPFAPLDNRGHASWTMTFDEQPALRSLSAAQLAGAKRLLKDVGYKIGAIDGKPDKATGAALNDFRKRMHFAPTAGNVELFDALEAEARKTNAPAGYTVCNDAHTPLLLALAQTEGGQPVSRGWWTAQPGACARLITTPLNGQPVYLLAQRRDGGNVVSGPQRFCITSQTFDIRGANNCAARGYGQAGFAATPTQGRQGFVAHVTATGLAH